MAGGVVHDFNNMLTAIMGYNEIIMMSSQEEDPTFHYLKGIKKSAERAAALTRQLLAFSRKQLLQPRVINLDEVITDLEAMLRRLIGKDIELRMLKAVLGWSKAENLQRTLYQADIFAPPRPSSVW